MIRAALLGAALGCMIACAGAQRASAPMAPTATDGGVAPVMPGDPHAQITALEHDITSRGGTFVPQIAASSTAVPMVAVPSSADASCHRAPSAQTATCDDSCKLADAICDDAKKICDIAAGLANDAWAAGKCDSGRDSCRTAHASCCSCS